MRLTYAPIAAILVACISLFSGHAQAAPQPYAICSNQTYALCAAASAFVYQEVSYAKCVIKNGNSISAPPLTYTENGTQKNICDLNAEGKTNGYMSSTFSLPTEVRRGGNKALYTCAGGSTGDYAQCDGGTCFTSTRGKVFPAWGSWGRTRSSARAPSPRPTRRSRRPVTSSSVLSPASLPPSTHARSVPRTATSFPWARPRAQAAS